MSTTPQSGLPSKALAERFGLRPTSGQRAVMDIHDAGRSIPFRIERRTGRSESYHYPPCCDHCRRTISTTDESTDTCNPQSHPEAWANAGIRSSG